MFDFASIQDRIVKFRDDRDWGKFHNPKDLAISISLEANEVLECFQWKTEEEVKNLSAESIREIQDEIADVIMYSLLLCDKLDINLVEAIDSKIKQNEEKYPIGKCKGSAAKYTEYL